MEEHQNPVMKRRKDGPNFLAKLRGHEVNVYFVGNATGEQYTLKAYNRYEILFEYDKGKPLLVMKHAIRKIEPLEDVVLFEEKKEGENHG